MIPVINDFTSYWYLGVHNKKKIYVGILFGENILVYGKKQYDLSQLITHNNSRIKTVLLNNDKTILYALFENTILYAFTLYPDCDPEYITNNVEQIFTCQDDLCLLHTNGQITDINICTINNNIIKGYNINTNYNDIIKVPSISANLIPYLTIENGALYALQYMLCIDKQNKFKYNDTKMLPKNPIIKYTNINIHRQITDVCICYHQLAILYDDHTLDMYFSIYDTPDKKNIVFNKTITGVIAISPANRHNIGILLESGTVVIHKYDNQENIQYKGIRVPNSEYCMDYGCLTARYFPQYFKKRFFAFIASVKYAENINIKMPKYLYFMVANYFK